MTKSPIQLHPDPNKPYIEIWGLDPLHLFKLGLYLKYHSHSDKLNYSQFFWDTESFNLAFNSIEEYNIKVNN